MGYICILEVLLKLGQDFQFKGGDMKRLLFSFMCMMIVAFLVCCNGCCGSLRISSSPHAKLSLPDLVAQEGGSSVALMMYHDDDETTKSTGYRPFCTGVWVDKTHILTANHCAKGVLENEQDRLDQRKKKADVEPQSLEELLNKIQNQENPEIDTIKEGGLSVHYIQENEVVDVGKEPSAWHLSKVVDFDDKHDLALLEAQGAAIPSHTIAKLAEEAPAIGESVHIVGQTVGLYWTYINGNVAAYRTKDMETGMESEGPWMQVSAPVYFGNSGGGAFNDYGELIGLADWIKRAPDVSFFIHVETLRSFLQDNHIGSKK